MASNDIPARVGVPQRVIEAELATFHNYPFQSRRWLRPVYDVIQYEI